MGNELDDLKRLADNLGKLLGSRCEIVIHDLSGDCDRTIVHIVNGEVSGRKVGDCPSSLFFEHAPDLNRHESELSAYFSEDNGRLIKSSTTFLRDEEENIVGAVCINLDVTPAQDLYRGLGDFLNASASTHSSSGGERFVRNVQELMDDYLNEAEREVGKPASQMNRAEKLRALAYLDQRGVLQINKAGVRLCEFFGISKFTLYHYLDEIRSGNDRKEDKTV